LPRRENDPSTLAHTHQADMTNAAYIARYLKLRGVTHVYELVGGMITFLIDSIHRHTDIRLISMHHEQGAGFAAEGWARIRGLPGVAMATSGPGATNLLTAIGSCYFDSVPAVFITGQVNRHEMKQRKGSRQLGFQETDIVAMAKPITKRAWLVMDPKRLPAILDEAFETAMSGRPGPVLIDVPMDVQRSELGNDIEVRIAETSVRSLPDPNKRSRYLLQLAKAFSRAKRPLVLAGGGIRSANAIVGFRRFVEHLGAPVVTSLMGVDVIPRQSPLHGGLIGSYGNRWSNLALAQSDLVLVLGSRLDIRQTGNDVTGFAEGRRFFHIDCERAEMNNRIKGCTVWQEQLTSFLEAAARELKPNAGAKAGWNERIAQLRAQHLDTDELKGVAGINPNAFIARLSQLSTTADNYVADVGQHQMWAAQSLQLSGHQRFLTSGGMGAMGFALPAGIGASLAGGTTIVIAGDGGFQLNIQELQTLRRLRLPVKIVVINNHCHGMVRQFQESYFDQRYHSTLWGYSAPDFVRVAEAYGIRAARIDSPDQIDAAIGEMMRDEDPYLLEVLIDPLANAYPKLAFGRKFGEMEPVSKPVEMEGT
jgi:acetolactate synthase-1/2/3 large subunit